ncbi:tetraspanin-8-like isoform X1 [Clupea harengus]|uniref:Tetraspanin-8-like isoform X1 n=1 Tax=Clupea harengus TaxID=7950 RepID=A0A6P8GIS5_CLUHA|nr:tetraspanin-8-like isoform X1 [Clupea harengus]
MAAVSTCLKKTFIVVNVITGLLGTIWLALTLFQHGKHHGVYESYELGTIVGFSTTYAVGVGIVVMCAVGLYGILKKKQWPLIVFSVGMFLVSLLFLVAAVSSAIASNMTEEHAKVVFKPEMPLDQESDIMQSQFEAFQYMYQCCGFLNGASDWGDKIPHSCQCPQLLENTTVCINLNVKTISGEIQVYRQPCFPYLFHIWIMGFKVLAAFAFICLLCLVVGPILSTVILCQMRRRTITPPVTFTAHSSGAKYTELE